MAERNQESPLVPAAGRSSDGDVSHGNTPALGGAAKTLRPRIFLKCCGASIFLLAVIIVILAFTVFKMKEPAITVNSYRVTSIDLINNNTTPKPGTNISFIADVSVKNSNAISFRHGNTTSILYYHGAVVGEARCLAGHMRARRTKRMNVTVDIIADNFMSSPYLRSDIRSGNLKLNAYSRVPGRLTVLKIKKHVVAKVNCSVTGNITAQTFQGVKCKWKVKF